MSIYSEGKEIIKDIISLSKDISDMELKNKILELQSTFYDLSDENRELKNKIHELKNTDLIDKELAYRNGVYIKGGNNKELYCSVCWDRDNKLVRARQIFEPDKRGNKVFQCDACRQWRYSDIPFEEK